MPGSSSPLSLRRSIAATSCAAIASGGYEEGLTRWPELAEHLAGARRVGPVQMMSRWHGYFRQSAGPGWALVGDAGHFKDPTPGQGISDALRQTVTLAAAIERGLSGAETVDDALRRWWAWRDRDAWEMYWFAQDMGATDRVPMLLRTLGERFAAEPRLVDDLMRVLSHDLVPSKLFKPSLVFSVFLETLRKEHGKRPALLAELRGFALEELRRHGRHLADIRRHGPASRL